jgi:hypothetical protein
MEPTNRTKRYSHARTVWSIGINDSQYQVYSWDENDRRTIVKSYVVWQYLLSNCVDRTVGGTMIRARRTIHKPWLSYTEFDRWFQSSTYEPGYAMRCVSSHYAPETMRFNPMTKRPQ